MADVGLRIVGLLCGGVFILGFAAAGVFLLIRFLQERKKVAASQSWQTVPGQVIATRVEEITSTDSEGDTSTSYSPAVTFTYRVGGQDYSSERMTFGARRGFGRPARAQQELARYPVGGQVAVYVDPADPANAVLERAARGQTLSLVLAIVFLSLSFCLGFMLLVSLATSLIARQ